MTTHTVMGKVGAGVPCDCPLGFNHMDTETPATHEPGYYEFQEGQKVVVTNAYGSTTITLTRGIVRRDREDAYRVHIDGIDEDGKHLRTEGRVTASEVQP